MTASSHQKQQFAALSILGASALIAVVLRVIARARSKASFGLDDGLIVGAVIFFLCYVSITIWGASAAGTGEPFTELPLPVLIRSLKVLYIDTLLTVLTISFAKLSVLCLYYRIFSVKRGFRIALITMGMVSILWMMACFLLGIWRCIPVRAAWNPLVKGKKCYDLQLAFLVSESINCVNDFIIVCMPVAVIRQLQLPARHKIGISLIFLVGGFVCITSIIRIIFTYHPKNSSYAILGSSLWCTIQLSFAIMCACLPTYRPILPKGDAFTSSLRRLYATFMSSRGRLSGSNSSTDDRGQTTEGNHRPRHGIYDKFNDSGTENVTLTEIGAVEQLSTHEAIPSDGIAVRSDVHIV